MALRVSPSEAKVSMDGAGSDPESVVCVICLSSGRLGSGDEDFRVVHPLLSPRRIDCPHCTSTFVHDSCLLRWLLRAGTCPTCRTVLCRIPSDSAEERFAQSEEDDGSGNDDDEGDDDDDDADDEVGDAGAAGEAGEAGAAGETHETHETHEAGDMSSRSRRRRTDHRMNVLADRPGPFLWPLLIFIGNAVLGLTAFCVVAERNSPLPPGSHDSPRQDPSPPPSIFRHSIIVAECIMVGFVALRYEEMGQAALRMATALGSLFMPPQWLVAWLVSDGDASRVLARRVSPWRRLARWLLGCVVAIGAYVTTLLRQQHHLPRRAGTSRGRSGRASRRHWLEQAWTRRHNALVDIEFVCVTLFVITFVWSGLDVAIYEGRVRGQSVAAAESLDAHKAAAATYLSSAVGGAPSEPMRNAAKELESARLCPDEGSGGRAGTGSEVGEVSESGTSPASGTGTASVTGHVAGDWSVSNLNGFGGSRETESAGIFGSAGRGGKGRDDRGSRNGHGDDRELTRQASYLLLTYSMLFATSIVASLSVYTYWRICMVGLVLIFGVSVSSMVVPADATFVMVFVATFVSIMVPVRMIL